MDVNDVEILHFVCWNAHRELKAFIKISIECILQQWHLRDELIYLVEMFHALTWMGQASTVLEVKWV